MVFLAAVTAPGEVTAEGEMAPPPDSADTDTPTGMIQSVDQMQWCFFGQNSGEVTPKNIYFHYLKISFLNQSVQKVFDSILKTEALIKCIFKQMFHKREE